MPQQIMKEQVDSLLGEVNYICFMGSVGSDPTKQTIVGLEDEEFYLLEAGEDIPEELNEQMNEESRQYMESYQFD